MAPDGFIYKVLRDMDGLGCMRIRAFCRISCNDMKVQMNLQNDKKCYSLKFDDENSQNPCPYWDLETIRP